MNRKIILVLIGVFFLLPSNAKALMCSNQDKLAFVEQAKNITVNYEYVEHDDDVDFTIKISNIPDKFIVYDAVNVVNHVNEGSEIVISNIRKNKTYKFGIYVDDFLCKGKLLYTHYIQIPAYNKYYKDELCKGLEDYKLCYKWLNTRMTYDEWKHEMLKYIDKLNQKEENKIKEEEKELFEQLFIIITNYYFIIIPALILILILAKVIYNKKHDLF